MKYANLQRAVEIAAAMPALERARELLSDEGAVVLVRCGMKEALLPRCVNMNVAAVVNAEMNRMRKEVEEL